MRVEQLENTPVPATPARERVDDLLDGAWALAALAVATRSGDADAVLDDELGAVLAAVGLAVTRGGAGSVLAPAVADLVRSGLAPALLPVLPGLLHVAGVAQGRQGWAEQDISTKIAQGEASGPGGRLLVTAIAARLDGLAEQLRTGAAALDVGCGVGEVAMAMAMAVPGLRVVGIDVLDDVVEVAQQRVAERGLSDRVTVRRQDVAALRDESAYDLVWLPSMFLADETVRVALSRIRSAMRPGGWLVTAGAGPSRTDLGRAVARWRASLVGSGIREPIALQEQLELAGFQQVCRIELGGSAPVVVAGMAGEVAGGLSGSTGRAR